MLSPFHKDHSCTNILHIYTARYFKPNNLSTSITGKRTIKLIWSTKVPLVAVRLGLRRIGETWGTDYRIAEKAFRSYGQNIPKRSNLPIKLLSVMTSLRGFVANENRPVDRFETIIDRDIEKCEAIDKGREVKPNVCLDDNYHELYILDETIEDCNIPDSPINVVTGSREINGAGSGLVATYTCQDGYELDYNLIPPICSMNGDWSKYDGLTTPCRIKTCQTANYLATAIKFAPALINQDNELRAIHGAKAYLNCQIMPNYVVCLGNGSWSELPTGCREQSSSMVYIITAISCIIAIILVTFAIIGVRYRLYTSKSSEAHYKTNFTYSCDGTKKPNPIYCVADDKVYEEINNEYLDMQQAGATNDDAS